MSWGKNVKTELYLGYSLIKIGICYIFFGQKTFCPDEKLVPISQAK